jgi:hypothetical protein
MKARNQLRNFAAVAVLALAPAMDVQADDKQVAIDELRSPTSPAFTILGVAPTNVVRPNTPRELAVEWLSAQGSDDGNPTGSRITRT